MSKNLTRKGLALGAVVALGSTLLAGAPASAAPAITIAPAAGTSYSFLSGERFDVKVYGNSELTAGFGNLKWEVKNTSGTSVTLTTTTTGSATADQNSTSSTDATITKTPASVGTTAGYNKLGLAIAASAEAAYQVRAYLELDGTAGLTSGDLASQSETVTFVKQANVTSTVSITSPVEGDNIVTAGVRFGNINNEQLVNTKVGLKFTKGDGNSVSGAPTQTVAAWDETKGFVAGTATTAALVKDSAVKVQAYYHTTSLTYADAEKIGAAQTALVVARKAATITSDALASTSIKNTVTTGTATAKTNSTFVVRALVKDGATTPVAVAGASVSAVVTAAGLSTTKTLAVNGTTYTDSTKLPGQGSVAKLALTTDASGYASVTLTTTGFSAAAGAITVAFTTENLAAVTETVDLADATYTAYALASNGNAAATTDGAAVSVPVAVYDQFGGVPADEYDVRAVFDTTVGDGYVAQATTASTSATSTFAALVGGKATLSLVDNGTGAGVNLYDITVEKRQSGGGYTGSSVAGLANFKVIIKDAADLVPGLITVTAGTVGSTTKISAIAGPVALNLNTYGAFDARAVLGTAPTVGAEQSLAGNVKTAASATAAAVLVPGAKVTFSGTGLQFHSVVDSKDIYSLDSATVYADASGAFDVRVISNKAGKQTITVTSGAVSQVVTVVFADAAAGTATSLVVTAPATVAPGRTFDVSALLTDKYGNPVAVSTTSNVRVSYDGPGQVVGSLPTTFGTDGIAKFRVVLASNDSGSATVTVKYDSADGDFADTTDIVKTATITVAAPAVVEPTSKIGTANARVYVNVKDGKGSVVTVKIGAKWFTRSALNNDYTLSFKSVKGKKVSVKVYVDGDLSSSKTITVK